MSRAHSKVLLVEGDEDRRVIPYLIEAHGVRWGERGERPVVHIQPFDGIENLLAPGEIEAQLKASGLEALGILVDANGDPSTRWRDVAERCRAKFPSLPSEIPANGLLMTAEDGLRLGVWLMPDNRSSGMMETFLTQLGPSGALFQHADEAWTKAKALKAPCRDAHADKARIHTWLAWQDPPGLQLHTAVLSKVLEPMSPYAAPFVTWFKTLYAL